MPREPYGNGGVINCFHPICEASVKNHYWGKVKAHSNGWFMGKDGLNACPKHLPEWVVKWRSKKGN